MKGRVATSVVFFIELLFLCWFLLLTLSLMLKSVTCKKLELSGLVQEWPPDTDFLIKTMPSTSSWVLLCLGTLELLTSSCEWGSVPLQLDFSPTHLPDILSNLDRRWQATDWGVEPFCWSISPLQCPGAGTFVFRGIYNFQDEYYLKCHLSRGRGANSDLRTSGERDQQSWRVQISGSRAGFWERSTHRMVSFSLFLSFLSPSSPSSLPPFLPSSLSKTVGVEEWWQCRKAGEQDSPKCGEPLMVVESWPIRKGWKCSSFGSWNTQEGWLSSSSQACKPFWLAHLLLGVHLTQALPDSSLALSATTWVSHQQPPGAQVSFSENGEEGRDFVLWPLGPFHHKMLLICSTTISQRRSYTPEPQYLHLPVLPSTWVPCHPHFPQHPGSLPSSHFLLTKNLFWDLFHPTITG